MGSSSLVRVMAGPSAVFKVPSAETQGEGELVTCIDRALLQAAMLVPALSSKVWRAPTSTAASQHPSLSLSLSLLPHPPPPRPPHPTRTLTLTHGWALQIVAWSLESNGCCFLDHPSKRIVPWALALADPPETIACVKRPERAMEKVTSSSLPLCLSRSACLHVWLLSPPFSASLSIVLSLSRSLAVCCSVPVCPLALSHAHLLRCCSLAFLSSSLPLPLSPSHPLSLSSAHPLPTFHPSSLPLWQAYN
eukprot:3302909-Rhodomonas_salina.2